MEKNCRNCAHHIEEDDTFIDIDGNTSVIFKCCFKCDDKSKAIRVGATGSCSDFEPC